MLNEVNVRSVFIDKALQEGLDLFKHKLAELILDLGSCPFNGKPSSPIVLVMLIATIGTEVRLDLIHKTRCLAAKEEGRVRKRTCDALDCAQLLVIMCLVCY